MYRKYVFGVISIILAAAMFSGCGSSTADEDTLAVSDTVTVTTTGLDYDEYYSSYYKHSVTTVGSDIETSITEAAESDSSNMSFSDESDQNETDISSEAELADVLNLRGADGFPYAVDADTPTSVAVFNTSLSRYYCLLGCQYVPFAMGTKVTGDFTKSITVYENDVYKITFDGVNASDRMPSDNIYKWLNDVHFSIENKTGNDITFSMACDSVNCLSVYSADSVLPGNVRSSDITPVTISAGTTASFDMNIDLPLIYAIEDVQTKASDLNSFVFTYVVDNKIRYIGMHASKDGIKCFESDDISDVCRIVNYRWRVDGYKTFVQNGNYGSIADIYYYSLPDSGEQEFRLKMGFVNNHMSSQPMSVRFVSVNGVDLAVSEATSLTIAPCSFAMADISTTFINSSKTVKSAVIEVNTGGVIKTYDLDFITSIECDNGYTDSDYFNKEFDYTYYVPGMTWETPAVNETESASDQSSDNDSVQTVAAEVTTASEPDVDMDRINSVLR